MKRERLETQLTISKMHAPESAIASACPGRAGGGGHLGIFWAGMCRPGLQIGTPFSKKKILLKLIPRSRNGAIFYTPF